MVAVTDLILKDVEKILNLVKKRREEMGREGKTHEKPDEIFVFLITFRFFYRDPLYCTYMLTFLSPLTTCGVRVKKGEKVREKEGKRQNEP